MLLLVLILDVVYWLMMVLIHHETIYLDRLTPHVNSIAIVSNSMNDSMNSVFILVYYVMVLIVVPSCLVVD